MEVINPTSTVVTDLAKLNTLLRLCRQNAFDLGQLESAQVSDISSLDYRKNLKEPKTDKSGKPQSSESAKFSNSMDKTWTSQLSHSYKQFSKSVADDQSTDTTLEISSSHTIPKLVTPVKGILKSATRYGATQSACSFGRRKFAQHLLTDLPEPHPVSAAARKKRTVTFASEVELYECNSTALEADVSCNSNILSNEITPTERKANHNDQRENSMCNETLIQNDGMSGNQTVQAENTCQEDSSHTFLKFADIVEIGSEIKTRRDSALNCNGSFHDENFREPATRQSNTYDEALLEDDDVFEQATEIAEYKTSPDTQFCADKKADKYAAVLDNPRDAPFDDFEEVEEDINKSDNIEYVVSYDFDECSEDELDDDTMIVHDTDDSSVANRNSFDYVMSQRFNNSEHGSSSSDSASSVTHETNMPNSDIDESNKSSNDDVAQVSEAHLTKRGIEIYSAESDKSSSQGKVHSSKNKLQTFDRNKYLANRETYSRLYLQRFKSNIYKSKHRNNKVSDSFDDSGDSMVNSPAPLPTPPINLSNENIEDPLPVEPTFIISDAPDIVPIISKSFSSAEQSPVHITPTNDIRKFTETPSSLSNSAVTSRHIVDFSVAQRLADIIELLRELQNKTSMDDKLSRKVQHKGNRTCLGLLLRATKHACFAIFILLIYLISISIFLSLFVSKFKIERLPGTLVPI